MSMYACVRTLRNGNPCRGQRLNRNVGPEHITLCNKHLAKYNEERTIVLDRIERDHKDGLHGEDAERQQFAVEYASGEFFVICASCRDELASEELGVPQEDVELARIVKEKMTQSDERLEDVKSRFIESFVDDPAHALGWYADDVKKEAYTNEKWKRVEQLVEGADSWRGTPPMNLVEAYNAVVEEMRSSLLLNRIKDDDERAAAAEFIRLIH